MAEVDKRATPTSTSDFVQALGDVFRSFEGTLPTPEQVGMLFAQWALETATGKSMYNYNVGNIKATDLANQNYFSQWTGEPGVKRPDGVLGEGANHFRAYDTLADGLKSWVSLLKASRYQAGWTGLKNNDVEAFAEGIAHGGYVEPVSQPSYINGILARYKSFMGNLPKLPKLAAPKANGYVIALGAALVFGVAYALQRKFRKKR